MESRLNRSSEIWLGLKEMYVSDFSNDQRLIETNRPILRAYRSTCWQDVLTYNSELSVQKVRSRCDTFLTPMNEMTDSFSRFRRFQLEVQHRSLQSEGANKEGSRC